ncbi:unnamed protein product [Symbiodinium natans]|uniref:Secreted protein n=1 Tax=Symbiodinium natans TaxID=878477 RepID=A0A812URL4_9DINO|nr:unnamed protein product [Symbiodinium natans]
MLMIAATHALLSLGTAQHPAPRGLLTTMLASRMLNSLGSRLGCCRRHSGDCWVSELCYALVRGPSAASALSLSRIDDHWRMPQPEERRCAGQMLFHMFHCSVLKHHIKCPTSYRTGFGNSGQ